MRDGGARIGDTAQSPPAGENAGVGADDDGVEAPSRSARNNQAGNIQVLFASRSQGRA